MPWLFLVVARCEAPKDPRATIATFRAIARRSRQAEFEWASPSGAETEAVRDEIARDPLPCPVDRETVGRGGAGTRLPEDVEGLRRATLVLQRAGRADGHRRSAESGVQG